jgi:hypothetical protein
MQPSAAWLDRFAIVANACCPAPGRVAPSTGLVGPYAVPGLCAGYRRHRTGLLGAALAAIPG